MRKIISSIVLLMVFSMAQAQIENPIKWTYSAKKIGDKLYELHITAKLDPKWHIYAQDAGEGPEPTSFSFSPNPLVKFDGKVKEAGKLEKSYDPNFKSILKFYSNEVDFVQKVRLRSNTATVVKGSVTYMVCTDRKCLLPTEVPFSIKLDLK